MEYKRINKTLSNDDTREFVLSNNLGIYVNTTVTGRNIAPYHGLYINQRIKNDEIYLSKMIEIIEIGKDKYYIDDYKTSEKKYGGVENLEIFNSYPVPTYIYEFPGVRLTKKIKLVQDKKILVVEYKIENDTQKMVKLTVRPCVTKRDLFGVKRASNLKFTEVFNSTATKICLSISENIYLYLKSKNMKYDRKEDYIRGINYDYMSSDGNLKTYVEDLYIPGNFEAVTKSLNTNTYAICVMQQDDDAQSINSMDIETDTIQSIGDKIIKINENYDELKALALTAYLFNYIDEESKSMVLLESIPYIKENDDYIKNIIAAIEGNYLILGRFKEAKKILESMKNKLIREKELLNNLDRCEAELLYVEALNRYVQRLRCDKIEIRELYQYIKDVIEGYINKSDKEVFMDDDYLLQVNSKKYIKINALWYNALKVLEFFEEKFVENSDKTHELAKKVQESIIESFYDDISSTMKYELKEKAFANFDMIYTLSLSYPVVTDEKIFMKLVDTAFKKLYTPFGMRISEKNSYLYDGYTYPHLMVHFLKANLRQMGVTRATQKLAYNLVKEILQEINKDAIGSVKYKYSEQTKKSYGYFASSLTNAEIIRAYDMLT